MRLAFLVDWESNLARSWVLNMRKRGHEILVISSRSPSEGMVNPHIGSLASDSPVLSEDAVEPGTDPSLSGTSVSKGFSRPSARVLKETRLGQTLKRTVLKGTREGSSLSKALLNLRLLKTGFDARLVRTALDGFDPHILHAMRIPFEGILAAKLHLEMPLIVSIWGNDLTLYARTTRALERATRTTLRTCDALHADCRRDLALARSWGFSPRKPSLHLPSGGGVDVAFFIPSAPVRSKLRYKHGVRPEDQVVLNTRGIRAYVDNDAFIRVAIKISRHQPNVRFIGLGLAEDARYTKQVAAARLTSQIVLTKRVAQDKLLEFMQMADLYVSPTWHDGTPNSLLEAMAVGLYPVCSDLVSIREWIEPRVNGLLFPMNPDSMSLAIEEALALGSISRTEATTRNRKTVLRSASLDVVSDAAEDFYLSIAGRSQ